MSSPDVCVLMTDGTNCYEEMGNALEVAGATPEIVHINQLREGDRNLRDFGGLVISGGFTYGDDIASGKVLANELTSYLSDQLLEFVDQDRPIIGVCNGFQVLVRTGLLPEHSLGDQTVTLTDNKSGHFECRWVDLSIGQTVCRFVNPDDFPTRTTPMQVAHGEGRFTGDRDYVADLMDKGQVVFSYAPGPSNSKPYNPNGSMMDIAGICDEKGLILGLMPHPERSVAAFHSNRSLTEVARNAGTTIFRNMTDLMQ